MKKSIYLALSAVAITGIVYGDYQQNDQYGSYQGQKISKDDQDLQNKVQDKLRSDSDYRNVNCQVSKGVVVLTGTVETDSIRKALKDDIQDIDGVKSIDDRLSVRKQDRTDYKQDRSDYNQSNYQNPNYYQDQDGQRSGYYQGQGSYQGQNQQMPQQGGDRELLNKIRDDLGTSSTYKNVNISVMNGVVVITGYVEKVGDRKDLKGKLIKIDGVFAIDDRVQVKSPESSYNQSVNTDRNLTQTVRNILSRTYYNSNVIVLVNDGDVTLKGTVNNKDEKTKIEDAISNIDGVKSVDNQLKVRDN